MPGGKHLLGMQKGRHIFGTARVGDKGQIVIPKEARKLYHISPGDTLLLLGDDENGIIITRPEVLNNIASQIIDQVNKEEREK